MNNKISNRLNSFPKNHQLSQASKSKIESVLYKDLKRIEIQSKPKTGLKAFLKLTIPIISGVTVMAIGIFLLLSSQNIDLFQKNLDDNSTNAGTAVESWENEKVSVGKIKISAMNSFTEVNEDSVIVISDIEEINNIKEAVNSVEKSYGFVDVDDPQFKVEFGDEAYFLWVSEKSGAIMEVKDTHRLYKLSNESVKYMYELLTSKFNNEQLHY